MMKTYKKITAIRLILALIIVSTLMPTPVSAAFIDFDGIGSWLKDKVTAIAWAEELPETAELGLKTINGTALMPSVQPLVGVLEVYEIFVTGYSSSVDETDSTPFITASGEYVRDGIVAANFLPLGTKLKIPEYFGSKIFTVKDRMARKHSEKVDVWFSSKELAKSFGKRKLQVQVIEEAI